MHEKARNGAGRWHGGDLRHERGHRQGGEMLAVLRAEDVGKLTNRA